MSNTNAIMVGNDVYTFAELRQLIIDYPFKVNGWIIEQNKGHTYLYYEKAFGLSDPLLTLRDPWNRSIRPWIYYTDDNPTIWQTRKAEHPSQKCNVHANCSKESKCVCFYQHQ